MKTDLELALNKATELLERICGLPFVFPSPFEPTLEQEIYDFLELDSKECEDDK